MSKVSLPESDVSCVTFVPGTGGLPKICVTTPWSSAEIYLHGAQVTHFQKHNEAPLLFLSGSSRFQKDAPIRGGIPICFPWFGPRGGVDGQPMHGFGRLKDWQLTEINHDKKGKVTLRFRWADAFEGTPFSVDYVVSIGEAFSAEFNVTNKSSDANFVFEECLHTYFTVGDIRDVSVRGLKGAFYLDKTANYARTQETPDKIIIDREVDRAYFDTTITVEILDARLKRKIVVEKSNSESTVVWNPWIERARQMADLGDEEYKMMVCVESGNVGANKITLPEGATSSMKVTLRSEPL